MELLFWILVFVGWVVLVARGLPWLEKGIDRVLDCWFFPCGTLKPRRPGYPSYLDKK